MRVKSIIDKKSYTNIFRRIYIFRMDLYFTYLGMHKPGTGSLGKLFINLTQRSNIHRKNRVDVYARVSIFISKPFYINHLLPIHSCISVKSTYTYVSFQYTKDSIQENAVGAFELQNQMNKYNDCHLHTATK